MSENALTYDQWLAAKNRELAGKPRVRAAAAAGKTVAAVSREYGWSGLTMLFTDGTYLHLEGGEDSGGCQFLSDDMELEGVKIELR